MCALSIIIIINASCCYGSLIDDHLLDEDGLIQKVLSCGIFGFVLGSKVKDVMDFIKYGFHFFFSLFIGQDRYLVLHKGCMYYYKDSNDKKAQGQFSLSGYR